MPGYEPCECATGASCPDCSCLCPDCKSDDKPEAAKPLPSLIIEVVGEAPLDTPETYPGTEPLTVAVHRNLGRGGGDLVTVTSYEVTLDLPDFKNGDVFRFGGTTYMVVESYYDLDEALANPVPSLVHTNGRVKSFGPINPDDVTVTAVARPTRRIRVRVLG